MVSALREVSKGGGDSSGVKMGATIFNTRVRESLTEKGPFKQDLEGRKQACGRRGGKHRAKGIAGAKVLRWRHPGVPKEQ